MRKLFLCLIIVIIALGVAMGLPQARQALGLGPESSNAEVLVTAVPRTVSPPSPPSPPPYHPPPPPSPPLPPIVAVVDGVLEEGVGEATIAQVTMPVRVFSQGLSAYLDFSTETLFTFVNSTDISGGVILRETDELVEFLERVGGIYFTVSGETPPPPGSSQFVSLVYEGVPGGVAFSPPGTITITYDDDIVPEGISEEELLIYWYDETIGEWVPLEDCSVDTENNIITAPVSHFSLFSVLAWPPTPSFAVSALAIEPDEVEAGGEVLISFTVANQGNGAGTYEARLVINGALEQSWNVPLAPNESETLTHTVTANASGLYNVEVGGRTGSFSVVEKPAPEPEEEGFPWVLVIVVAGAVLALAEVVFVVWGWGHKVMVWLRKGRDKIISLIKSLNRNIRKRLSK